MTTTIPAYDANGMLASETKAIHKNGFLAAMNKSFFINDFIRIKGLYRRNPEEIFRKSGNFFLVII